MILELLTSDAVLSLVSLLLSALIGRVTWSSVRKRNIAWAVEHAYNIVNDIAKSTDNKIDDKAALGLQKINEILAAQGWGFARGPLSAKEQAMSKLMFSSIHGAK